MVVEGATDFVTAEKACKDLGANLPKIHHKTQQDYVHKLAGKSSAWLGTSRASNYWHDQKLVHYKNYAPNDGSSTADKIVINTENYWSKATSGIAVCQKPSHVFDHSSLVKQRIDVLQTGYYDGVQTNGNNLHASINHQETIVNKNKENVERAERHLQEEIKKIHDDTDIEKSFVDRNTAIDKHLDQYRTD